MSHFHIVYQWLTIHWKEWGIKGFVAASASAITWTFAARKEWKASRQAKKDRAVDLKVLEALGNRSLWTGSRPFTGGGDVAVRSAELSEHLAIDQESVIESLSRLEMRGRARNSGGTLDGPAPYWHILNK